MNGMAITPVTQGAPRHAGGAKGPQATGPHRGARGPGWADAALRVEGIIAEYVSRAQSEAVSDRTRALWGHIEDSLDGGKRLRPQLVWVAYTAFGGTDVESCAAVGAAFELLHGALVVHDDVIDRDVVRRGRPNIVGTYRAGAEARGLGRGDASHLGSSVAIIAGDLLLAASFRVMERATADLERRGRLSDVLHGAVGDAAGGELTDVLMAHHHTGSLDDVLEMERQKTAVYSFAAPLSAGAVLAGATDGEVAATGRVGSMIGMAYQVIDDVLGTFGDPRQTGKSVTSDLREGKLTVLTAFAKEDPLVAAQLSQRGISGEDPAPDASRLRDALRRSGADDYALGLAHSLVTEALAEARRSDLPSALRSELTRICNHVLHRES